MVRNNVCIRLNGVPCVLTTMKGGWVPSFTNNEPISAGKSSVGYANSSGESGELYFNR